MQRIIEGSEQSRERTVDVMLRVKVDGKWKCLLAAYGRNGRIRPGCAQSGDRLAEFTDPAYELRLYEGRQPKYIPVGRNATDADAKRKKLEESPSKTAVKKAAESVYTRAISATKREANNRVMTMVLEAGKKELSAPSNPA
jgi:hypothetical protein